MGESRRAATGRTGERGYGPLRVVVRGGIGSGKSEVGRMLAERGFAVLDADRVGHEVLRAGHPVATQVAERWPEAVIDGTVDRRLLGRIVFEDPAQLADLEELTHPAIRRSIERWAAGVGDQPAAVELPLIIDLVDDRWVRVTVDAPIRLRRARLKQRSMSEDDIDARMAVQPDRDQWCAGADLVLDNRGSRQSLASEVDRLVEHLRPE